MKIATLKSKQISGNTFYNDITIKIKLIIIKISLEAFFEIKDFDKLSQEVVQRLILKLAYKDRATETIAYTTRINFDKLPKEFRESLFVKLADIDNTIVDVLIQYIATSIRYLQTSERNYLSSLQTKTLRQVRQVMPYYTISRI